MNTKTLHKHYDKLADLERFKLALAANARGDDSELAALRSTARQATYTMTAWPYAGMFDGREKAVWVTMTDILSQGWHLSLCWTLGNARRERDDGADDDDDRFVPWLAAHDYAENVLSLWAGLALFCEDLGIEFDHALKQAPATDAAAGVVDFARVVLEGKERFLSWLASDLAKEAGEDTDQVTNESMAAVADARKQRTREYADLLRQLWDREID